MTDIVEIDDFIQKQITAIEKKGFHSATVQFEYHGSHENRPFKAFVKARSNDMLITDGPADFPAAETWDELTEKIDSWVKDLQSVTEEKLNIFKNKLGRLIDEGRDLDIEINDDQPDIVKMLEDTMKSLTENIITHRRPGAE